MTLCHILPERRVWVNMITTSDGARNGNKKIKTKERKLSWERKENIMEKRHIGKEIEEQK